MPNAEDTTVCNKVKTDILGQPVYANSGDCWNNVKQETLRFIISTEVTKIPALIFSYPQYCKTTGYKVSPPLAPCGQDPLVIPTPG